MIQHKQPTTTVNVRNVPTTVRDTFKAWCARRGYTMQDAMAALMRKAVDDNKPLPRCSKGSRDADT